MKIAFLSIVALQAVTVHGLVVTVHKQNVPAPAPAAAPAPSVASTASPVSAAPLTTTPMQTVKHDKEPSGGYVEGSPLYKKQEAREANKSLLSDLEDEVGAKAPTMKETLQSSAVYVFFVLAFACLYSKSMVQPLQARVKGGPPSDHGAFMKCGFAYSCSDASNIGSDWKICLWSCCCPIVQWAGTASKSATPFMSFWAAVGIMLFLVILSPFTYGITGVAALVLLLVRRRSLRQVYNHTHPTARSWVEDLCCVFCCNSFLCCQLVQEAREVEFTSPKVSMKPDVPQSNFPMPPVQSTPLAPPSSGRPVPAFNAGGAPQYGVTYAGQAQERVG